MKQFIRINGKEFAVTEVVEKLGISGSVESFQLCQRAGAGMICADIDPGSNLYPYIDLMFELPVEKQTVPIQVARLTHDAANPDEEVAPRCFLYGRRDDYIAFFDVDIRTDDQVDDEGDHDSIIVSGSGLHNEVDLYYENDFVHHRGIWRASGGHTTFK